MTLSDPFERQLLMAGYILGNLNLEESQDFERLLAEDTGLQQELAQLQLSLEQLYGTEETPPPALKASVLERAERPLAHLKAANVMRSQSVVEPQRKARFFSNLGFSNLGWFVSALLLAFSAYLGWQNFAIRRTVQVRQADPTQTESAQRDRTDQQAAYALTTTENATDRFKTSSVDLLIDADGTQGTLQAKGLPALPEDRVYVLWTVTTEGAPITVDDKNAILTAVLEVDELGDLKEKIALPSVFRDAVWIEKMAITVEDKAAPQNHESSPVLGSQL